MLKLIRSNNIMPRNFLLKLNLIFLSINYSLQDVSTIREKQNLHTPLTLSDSVHTKLSDLNDLAHFNQILDNILIPRVVDTPTHKNVREYIVKQMEDLKWTVELDEFRDTTPNMGTRTFTNIIAKLNPDAERFLVFSAHYDSKYFADFDFLGATDSAVPCAMLVNMVKTMKAHLDKIKADNNLSLMFIFFDGEEAFLDWTKTDSIYGSRHLAAKWEKEGFLHRIDMLVLLDLLGAPDPTFHSLNKESLPWYLRLVGAERKLAEMNLLKSYSHAGLSSENPPKYFHKSSIPAGVEDDHVPFLERGVKILHLIPLPFPNQWHKIDDDRKSVDLATCENLMKIFRTFIAEYLHLSID